MRPYSASYLPPSSPGVAPSLYGRASSGDWPSSPTSRAPGPAWRNESGFLLAGLLPILLLLLAALAGSWAISWQSQERVALQSRLDLCAVRLAVARERTLDRLTSLNGALRLTVHAIYAARGVELLGPVGFVLGEEAEAVLLGTNRTLAGAENALVAVASALELSRLRCAPDPYSREPAACWVSPALPTALAREQTLFPDVEGALVGKKATPKELARIRCQSASPLLATVLRIQGDPQLAERGFTDAYEK